MWQGTTEGGYNMIVVRNKETGMVIVEVESVKAGEELISVYEDIDKEDGIYTPDFYEVAELEE